MHMLIGSVASNTEKLQKPRQGDIIHRVTVT